MDKNNLHTINIGGNDRAIDGNTPLFDASSAVTPWTDLTVAFEGYDTGRTYYTFAMKTPSSGTNAAECLLNGTLIKYNDASLTAGQLIADTVYRVDYDSSNSAFNLYDIHNMNEVVKNLTPNLILKETEDDDIYTYSRTQIDSMMSDLEDRQDVVEAEVGVIAEFSPYTTYTKNSYVKYGGKYYRCKTTTFIGAWDPTAWQETTLLEEIKDIRGSAGSVETITVNVSVNRGSGVVADTSIRIVYDSVTGKAAQTLTLDSSGSVTFYTDYEDRYYIEGSGISGYLNPQSDLYVAGIPQRVINLQYRMLGTGVFIVDNNGVEHDVELWDPVNNANARFVKFTNSTLCPGGLSHDNSIIISKLWASQRKGSTMWQIEYKDLPSLTNITATATAEADYNGWQNCELAYTDCTTPNTAGKTFVDLYNEAHAEEEGFTPITIAEYLPAIYYAKNVSETFLDKTVYGYLPSMGQLRQMSDNIADINAALTKIGAGTISINSGYWWSSTEGSYTYSWNLDRGTTNLNSIKSNTYDVLPLFAL